MIKPIKNEEQYQEALRKMYNFMQLDYVEGSPEADEMEVWAMLIEDYEDKHYPIMLPTFTNPLDAINFRIKEMGWNEADLNKILGYGKRKSEILSGKRKLSLTMIRKLHQVLKIPAETLIAEY
jgi:HTH-type transcriptional regulator/antitoxin HigA